MQPPYPPWGLIFRGSAHCLTQRSHGAPDRLQSPLLLLLTLC